MSPMTPMTPESESTPSFSCVVRMPSTSSPIDRSNSPSEVDSRSDVTEVTATNVSGLRRDRFANKALFTSILCLFSRTIDGVSVKCSPVILETKTNN